MRSVSLIATGFIAAAALWAPTAGADAPEQDKGTVSGVIADFARERGAAMLRVANQQGLAVPSEYEELLAAMEAGDWPSASNRFERIKARIGQYEDSESDPALDNALWPYAQEAAGAFEQAALWDPDLLDLYAEEMMRAIPDGAVYFGGTDPGRFVITAYRIVGERPFHVITQNALADAQYMAYLRETADPELDIPSPEDCNGAFQQYVEDIQAGRIPAGAEVSIEDGRVSVVGVQGVMMINGIISRMIFDRNKKARDFYLEESYVIPWMYPHLEPRGPIMKLNSEPGELTPEILAQDRAYWDDLTARLKKHPAFDGNAMARRTFSKLRAAIAGLYQARGLAAEAEYAFRQALELDPHSPEACFRHADSLMQAGRFDEAFSLIQGLAEHDPANEHARSFLNQILNTQQLTQRRKELEKKIAGGGTPDEARELLEIYRRLGLTGLAAALQERLDEAGVPDESSRAPDEASSAEEDRPDMPD